MAIEIKVPTVGESISEVTLVKWLKKDGEWANRDEVIAELESEKATFELNAEQAGAIKIIAAEGDTLKIGDVVCSIDTDAVKPEGAVEAVLIMFSIISTEKVLLENSRIVLLLFINS